MKADTILRYLKIYSQNSKFYILIAPQDEYAYCTYDSDYNHGSASVYLTANDSLLYTIDKLLIETDEYYTNCIFLTDDGKYLLNINNTRNKLFNSQIYVFEFGKLINIIDLEKYIDVDKYENILYENIELIEKSFDSKNVDKNDNIYNNISYKIKYRGSISKYKIAAPPELVLADKFKAFIHDNIFYVFLQNLKLLVINPTTLVVNVFNLSNEYNNVKDIAKWNIFEIYDYNYDTRFHFPLLATGDSLETMLSKELGLKCENDALYRMRTFEIRFSGYLKNDGYIKIDKIEKHSIFDSVDIKGIIEKQKFYTGIIPSYTDKWFIRNVLYFRNFNDSIARAEYGINLKEEQIKKDYQRSLDTINGVYIPKDLNDCMLELDKKIKLKDKEEYKNLENAGKTGKYHFGLGRGLRNVWRLWGGSRLEKYFEDFGHNNADDISGIILEAYWHYLNNKPFELTNISDKNVFKLDSNVFIYFNKDCEYNISNIEDGKCFIFSFDTSNNLDVVPAIRKSTILKKYFIEPESFYDDNEIFSNDFIIPHLHLISKYVTDNFKSNIRSVMLNESEFFLDTTRNISYDNKIISDKNFVFYINVNKRELDSIDSFTYKKMLEYASWNDKYKYYDNIKDYSYFLQDYLKDKPKFCVIFYRIYPKLRFDWSEIKK